MRRGVRRGGMGSRATVDESMPEAARRACAERGSGDAYDDLVCGDLIRVSVVSRDHVSAVRRAKLHCSKIAHAERRAGDKSATTSRIKQASRARTSQLELNSTGERRS